MSMLSIVRRIRIEPFIFLFYFSNSLENITTTQLAQDKICLYKYGQTPEFCAKLSEQVSSETEFDFKSQILADVTQFTLYKIVISTTPEIFWSLFLGSWADRHSCAPKVLMSSASIGLVLKSALLLFNAIYFEIDVNQMLFSFIPFSLFGGTLSITMSFYSYISTTTETKSKTLRYAIIESLIFIAAPLGTFIGGELISATIRGSHGQLHNYMRVFTMGLIAQILASVWIIFIPFEKSLYSKQHEGSDQNNNLDSDKNIMKKESIIETSDETEPLIVKSINDTSLQIKISKELSADKNMVIRDKHWFYIFNDIIDLQNIRDVLNTCTKQRSDRKRTDIWILVVSLALIALTNHGAAVVIFQFVQRVFQWNAEIYSIVNSLVLVTTSMGFAIVVPILIKLLKVSDISLSIIGVMSLFTQNIIRGTVLNESAFYVSFIFGSLAHVPQISVRSKLSKIVNEDEKNKIFGLLSTLDTLTHLLSSIIYSIIFESTLVLYPGLVFQISCAFIFISLSGFINISLFSN